MYIFVSYVPISVVHYKLSS